MAATRAERVAGLCECGCGQPAPISRRNDSSNGRVAGQPQRFVKGHKAPNLTEKYDVDEATGCWVWNRHRNSKGYGMLRLRGHLGTAHRIFYELHVGRVPAGLTLDHLCRNRACVNPAHLEAVTHIENVHRGDATKLSDEQVREIRSSPLPAARVAEAYGIRQDYVRDLRSGRARPLA